MLTRRKFLAGSAASGFLPATPSLAQFRPSTEKIDIAVVGGGVAGLYSAMRLKTQTDKSVTVFEGSDRIGGRLLSMHFPDVASQTAEIGGMRLRHTDEIALKLVRDLIGADHLQDFDYPTTGYFLRDRHLVPGGAPSKLPYFFDAKEEGILGRGDDLLTSTIDALVREAKENPDRFRGEGVWELLLKTRSKDGVNYIRDALGYNSPVSNWDATTALPWFAADFDPNTRYYKLHGGLEQIPHAAGMAFVASGGTILKQNRLRHIGRNVDGSLSLVFQTSSGQRHVIAEQVILALPRYAIESLSPDSVIFENPRFHSAMKAVHKVPLAKIHMSFTKDWWTPRNLTDGRQVTDLPVRQIYRWGSDPATGSALLMASYHDGPFIEFWDSLSVGPNYGQPDWIKEATGPAAAPLAASLQDILPASKPLVLEAWRQVRLAHGLGDDIPPPVAATYQNWSRAPWGAAVHFWSVLANPTGVMKYLQSPYRGVHVCNEAWSNAQGWIHGATESAEALLVNEFGLAPYLET